MSNPWLPILQGLPLSRTEREVVRRFEQDPDGRTFLPVADILRSHRLHDECLELLTRGVEKHPGFTVARVVLARDLLQKGLVEQAWRTLEDSRQVLKDNLLAQKLRFRLALLLDKEDVARKTLTQLQSLPQAVDPETKRLADAIDLGGVASAREALLKEMRDRGTTVSLPAAAAPAPAPANSIESGRGIESVRSIELGRGTESGRGPESGRGIEAGPSTESGHGIESGRDDPSPFSIGASESDEEEAPRTVPSFTAAESRGGAALAALLEGEDALAGYHVVPLDEIFRPGGDASSGQSTGEGVELDSTTLADIYARQGHFGKALAVYRRLLRLMPHSDLLSRKVAELARLEKEQRDVELTVDPALVDRMETVEIIDRQIKFYNDLLSRLT